MNNMTTRDIVASLRRSMDSEYLFENDDKVIGIMQNAANKIEELQRIIDGINGDHYVDYLDFYANRCMELEEILEKAAKNYENSEN